MRQEVANAVRRIPQTPASRVQAALKTLRSSQLIWVRLRISSTMAQSDRPSVINPSASARSKKLPL